MYAAFNRSNQSTQQPSQSIVTTMSPEEFCDRFLPLRHAGDKLNPRSGRRSRCLRFLSAVLTKFTGQTISESRIDKWGPGLSFSNTPCPFTALLALLAQFQAEEIKKIAKYF
ncbi:hypothetical protein [Laspinema olomoucense]|jgi:hypothetical protein|uniref:hypothetical protein n=1 Tax=Laspinema olomoucense TaxID=3231600 RepID=UPI0021BBB5E3|nr:hypothetical protein [Laspinema sp. D3d]MCT7975665.1 hypothetical protein [Laspinema sp. D3d]